LPITGKELILPLKNFTKIHHSKIPKMKNIPIYAIVLSIVMMTGCTNQKRIKYPETKKVDQTDDYFGTQVADPYRWLENDTSAETEAWVKAENAVTFAYLEKIPYREKIKERLTKIWNYPKVSAPFKRGGHFFLFRNEGLQNQDVAFIKDALDGAERMILNPNKLSEDGTVSLTDFTPSKDGKYIGYGISRGGSDWNEFYVKSIATGNDLSDHLEWIKFSPMAWYNDGFFYSRYEKPAGGTELSAENKNNRLYYHKIGDLQDKDLLVFEDAANPYRSFASQVTEDGRYLVLYAFETTTGNALYVKDLKKENSGFVKLVDTFDNNYSVIDHANGQLLIRTDFGAPKYRVMAVDMNNPAKEKWVELIPEKENVLNGVSLIGGKLIAEYMKDAHSKVELYDLAGKYLYDINFPILGTVSGFSGTNEDTITFYSLTSFTTPSIVYKYNVMTNTSTEYSRSKIDFNPDPYETKQVFFTSKDGTKVPMFIVYKKGIELNGKNPTLLYGYGGFNVTYTPRFSIGRVVLLENGFVFALASIRGGGEYGEDWHKAGTLLKKQNVFDDFIAATEYLIDNKYTSSEKLAIEGGSNGGLLIGAVVNQRPDLFHVALPEVGVMDMLRYHKFTIGKYWASDYGTSEDSQEMFRNLYAYSPLHNIKAGLKYPAIMATTADHDDRVVPAHSFKYMATMQENYKGLNPVLIRIETSAGHGGGTPTTKMINEYTDLWSFVMYNLCVTPKY
jgi:prolyl oligopeptidase